MEGLETRSYFEYSICTKGHYQIVRNDSEASHLVSLIV